MNSRSSWRSGLRTTCLLIAIAAGPMASVARAQGNPSTPSHESAVSIAGIFSIQPTPEYRFSPYIDGALGGNVPGILVSISTAATNGLTFSADLSSTWPMSRMQTGRLVLDVPTEIKHRDTMISLLPGFRQHAGGGWMNYRGGISFVLGQSWRAGESLNHDIAGAFALSGGIDWAGGARHAPLLPLSYSYMFRGDENYFVGLAAQRSSRHSDDS